MKGVCVEEKVEWLDETPDSHLNQINKPLCTRWRCMDDGKHRWCHEIPHNYHERECVLKRRWCDDESPDDHLDQKHVPTVIHQSLVLTAKCRLSRVDVDVLQCWSIHLLNRLPFVGIKSMEWFDNTCLWNRLPFVGIKSIDGFDSTCLWMYGFDSTCLWNRLPFVGIKSMDEFDSTCLWNRLPFVGIKSIYGFDSTCRWIDCLSPAYNR